MKTNDFRVCVVGRVSVFLKAVNYINSVNNRTILNGVASNPSNISNH